MNPSVGLFVCRLQMSFILVKEAVNRALKGELQGAIRETIRGTILGTNHKKLQIVI